MAFPITETFYLHNSGTKVTGQAANLAFRVSPYAAGNVIAGLTFTETPASSGQYVCTGFDTGTGYYSDVKLFLSGVEQTSYGIRDIGDPSSPQGFVSKTDTNSQTMAGAIAMGSNKITGLAAATANGDATRYEQVVRLTDDQTVAGVKTFSSIPVLPSTAPSSGNHATNKDYVDGLFGGAIGYQIATGARLIVPSRTTNIDNKVYKSLEEGASNIATEYIPTVTKRGILLLQTVDTAAGSSILTPANVGWATAYIDLKSDRKAKINVSIADSYTIDMEIYNCHIIQDSSPTASFTNFKFINCIIEFTASNDVTFTTCHFDNCIIKSGGTLTLSNCKGRLVYCNATITWNGSTKPLDVTDGADINNLGV